SGNIGDNYTTDQKAIDGYTFKEVQGKTTGVFTNQAQNITYVYTKANTNSSLPESNDNTRNSTLSTLLGLLILFICYLRLKVLTK
ncbi:MucBP domain-containing protein, partial [Lactococcus lactis]|uniref:MucBP domain-containing protein n=1 Tax=Lactococcus lactis TaxID=1358 RepID=UPI0024A97060